MGHQAEVLLDMFQTYNKTRKRKASLSSALCSDKFLESSFDELNTTSSSAQSLIGGSSPTRYESISGEGMESTQTGLGTQISTQTVRKQLKGNLKLSDSAANRLIDMQWPFLKKKAGGRDLKMPPAVHRVTDITTGKVDETISQDVTEDISHIALLQSVNQPISQEHDITQDALCVNQQNPDMELKVSSMSIVPKKEPTSNDEVEFVGYFVPGSYKGNRNKTVEYTLSRMKAEVVNQEYDKYDPTKQHNKVYKN